MNAGSSVARAWYPAALLAAFLSVDALACRPAASTAADLGAGEGPAPHEPFVESRRLHPTMLRSAAPSPERLGEPPTPAAAEAVRYPSPAGDLLAWFAKPAGGGPHPVLVYFHGGFALAPSDFALMEPVLAARWAVMTPSWRGENGNPGSLELLFGELDDAIAAIAWAADQPGVDPARIHVLGHSVGGGLAALVSLRPDAKVVDTASVGGLYVPETFVRWAASAGNAKLVRFDPAVRTERELRVLGPHLADMVHPHQAYVGRQDLPFVENAAGLLDAATRMGAPLRIEFVDGDHESSLRVAIAVWLAAHGATP